MSMRFSQRRKFFFVQGLTLSRIPLILLFLAVTIYFGANTPELWFAVAFTGMILSAVTDLLDGYFARLFRVTSNLGSYADPMTDKVFYLTTFPTLVYLASCRDQQGHARLLVVLAILFLLRDQWVTFLRSLGALHNLSAKANWSGKARTVVSFPTICLIYYYLAAPKSWGIDLPPWLIYGLEGVSMLINLVSIVVYTSFYWPALRAELRVPDDKDPPR
jgi:CDP-diacylglycerol--glycerol-3-phosphate 3-phosphatidyltransferase